MAFYNFTPSLVEEENLNELGDFLVILLEFPEHEKLEMRFQRLVEKLDKLGPDFKTLFKRLTNTGTRFDGVIDNLETR